jgi:Fic family protein
MTYKPKYSNTHKTLDNISKILLGKHIIENSKAIPKWELKLTKEAIINSAYSSTKIEGNNLTLEQVTGLFEQRQIIASKKDTREVKNYLEALAKIPCYASNKNRIQISKLMCKYTRRFKIRILFSFWFGYISKY